MKIQFSALFCVVTIAVGCGAPAPGTDTTTVDLVAADSETGLDDNIVADSDAGWDCDEMMVDCGWSGYECHGPTTFADRWEGWCVGPCCRDGYCEIILHECPEGTRCHGWSDQPGMTAYSDNYPCLPLNCDSEVGPFCPEGSFCDTVVGTCSGPGTCIPMENGVYPFGQESEDNYSCGCDGYTYGGGRARIAAGTPLAHVGECCVPTRLNMTIDNPEGFGTWKACASRELVPGSREYLRTLLQWAHYGEQGSLIGCAEGEVGYVGALILDQDGKIDAAQFDALCKLASIRIVSLVRGEPADYCDVNCHRGLACRDTVCPSPCGCCPCETGTKRCIGTTAVETCTSEGCWQHQSFCDKYSACVTGEAGSGCALSCDVMLASLKEHAKSAQTCEIGEDCRTVAGFCEPADGPCWLPFNGEDTPKITSMSSFQVRWKEAGCWNQEACGCGPAPTTECVDGLCQIQYSQLPVRE